MNWEQLLNCALDIGEQMEVAGAEVYRVEDCIQRICLAYGAQKVDVFTITSCIILTVQQSDGTRLTQTRRIKHTTTNLARVDQLNQLSRWLCEQKLTYDQFLDAFDSIMSSPQYPHWVEYVMYMFIAAAFTIFYGGKWFDGLVSMGVGLILRFIEEFHSTVRFNRVISLLTSSFLVSILTLLLGSVGVEISSEAIIIGNIMLLIPGVGFTNSLRDIINSDTMSGMLRLFEACIYALAIAEGYHLAIYFMEVFF